MYIYVGIIHRSSLAHLADDDRVCVCVCMYDDASVIHRNTRSWPMRRIDVKPRLERLVMFADSGEIPENRIGGKRKEEERKSGWVKTDREDFRILRDREREREVDLCVGICWLMGVREV